MQKYKTLSEEQIPKEFISVYGMNEDAELSNIRYPLLRSVAHSGRYIAKINNKYYNLRYNTEGKFLFTYVKTKAEIVAVKVNDGDEFDGHLVEIYYYTFSRSF